MKVGERYIVKQRHTEVTRYAHLEVTCVGYDDDVVDYLTDGAEYAVLVVERVVTPKQPPRVLVDVPVEPPDVPLEVPYPEVVA